MLLIVMQFMEDNEVRTKNRPNYYLISLLQNPFIIVSDKCETFFCELGKMYGPLKIFAGGKN